KISDGTTTETVAVNKTIEKLAQTLAEAKTAAEGAVGTFALTNATTQTDLENAVKAVVTNTNFTVTVEGYTLTPATTEAAGSLAATLKISDGTTTETVAVNKTIEKLAQTLAEAKTAAEGAVGTFAPTNATTQTDLENAVKAVVTNTNFTVTVEGYTLTPATTEAAGSLTATVKISDGTTIEEVTVTKVIAKLAPTAPAANDITFTLNTATGGDPANGSVAVANVAAGTTVTVYAADGTTKLGTATNSGTEVAKVTVEGLAIEAATDYQVSVTVGGVESAKITKKSQAIDLVSVTYDNGTLATNTDDTFILKFSDTVNNAGADTDYTVTFDNASATYTDADITLTATDDYTVTVLNNEVVITLTEIGLAKIDEIGKFDNGLFKIVIKGSALTPIIDGVQSFVGTLANSDITAAD
ncbi:hypothetical protein ACFSO7_02610, partial [Bacillus sp. CGMCC 1.16607]|uniref:hypothetical protein n=1 Tax=Bacillus sp. CGMCC 1.16607 TaxID=3351842 RepID=UPI003644CF75